MTFPPPDPRSAYLLMETTRPLADEVKRPWWDFALKTADARRRGVKYENTPEGFLHWLSDPEHQGG